MYLYMECITDIEMLHWDVKRILREEWPKDKKWRKNRNEDNILYTINFTKAKTTQKNSE